MRGWQRITVFLRRGSTAAVLTMCVLALAQDAGTPPTATAGWPPYRADADPDTEGNQPGYDTEAPGQVPGHTKSLWKPRIHVAPGTNPDGTTRKVCDVHFVPPPGKEFPPGSVSEAAASGNPEWAAKMDKDKGTISFHSNCTVQMPASGLNFIFSVSATDKPDLRDYKIILTDDGSSEVPGPGATNVVAILRETGSGKPLKFPFAANTVTPSPSGYGSLAMGAVSRVHVVALGESVTVALSLGGDDDYRLFASASLDGDGLDGSQSGVNGLSDPLPLGLRPEFGSAEAWANSEGSAANSISFPTDPQARGTTIYVGTSVGSEALVGPRELPTPLAFYVAFSEMDFDGDGALNEGDAAPLDPNEQ